MSNGDAGPAMFVPWDVCGSRSCRRRRGSPFAPAPLRLGSVEEADELLVPVALHVAADDGAVEHIEGGEQRRCAMAFVVVGHRPSAALLHRQTGLGAVERLDLALLIYREDDGVGGRIDIETDDVPELLDKLRVLRQFERPD